MASSPAPSIATSASDSPASMLMPEPEYEHESSTTTAAEHGPRFVTKEKTPTSLVLKLKIPPRFMRELAVANGESAAVSIQSSPPPSSPIASTSVMDIKPVVKKKSGPKPKKTKIVIGEDGKPVEVLAVTLAGPRLGPKSNAGAINENLRNLDRSGKPCRRWTKQAITVRSMYGAKWRAAGWLGEADPAVP